MFVGGAEKSEEVDKHTKRRKLGVRGFVPRKKNLISSDGCSSPSSPPVSVLGPRLYSFYLKRHRPR